MKAMEGEMNSIIKNDTQELFDFLKDKKCIGLKWIYKISYNSDGTIESLKARFVAKDLIQKYGIDHKETFVPIER